MNILIVNNGKIPVQFYGGTERVIWYLGRELVDMGHKVSFLVDPGSSCDFAEVIAHDPLKHISALIPAGTDIVHYNFTPPGYNEIDTPYIVTVHGNSNTQAELDMNTVFVSGNHAQRFGSSSFVYNGLNWNDYTRPSFDVKRNYFHFLGKAAWRVKNVKGAINVIRRTRKEKLKVLGGKRFNINMGMRFTFTPRARFYGMVGGKEKFDLLQHSKGLIFPVRWHEPFGLAIIESLYYGCPVFGTPYGSLPELVPAEAGYLSNSCDELAKRIEDAGVYSNRYCHEYAAEHFNSKKMAFAYLERYEKVISGKKLNSKAPRLLEVPHEKFLPWEE
ncbi:MAG: glycosyltransferase [Ferruginibacter sp.]